VQQLIAGVAAGSFLVGAVTFYKIGKCRGRSISKDKLEAQIERKQSQDAHNDAVEREPPVDIGDDVTVGVKEVRSHHSGDRQAVCKKQGFVIFVENFPQGTEVGDSLDVSPRSVRTEPPQRQSRCSDTAGAQCSFRFGLTSLSSLSAYLQEWDENNTLSISPLRNAERWSGSFRPESANPKTTHVHEFC
jgi:predicted RNA-binding protein with TRAM domain